MILAVSRGVSRGAGVCLSNSKFGGTLWLLLCLSNTKWGGTVLLVEILSVFLKNTSLTNSLEKYGMFESACDRMTRFR